MTTSLIETQRIERYLSGSMEPGDRLVFEARRMLDAELDEKVTWQQKVYRLVRLYFRKQKKKELEEIHRILFSDPDKKEFQDAVYSLFKH